MRKIILSMLVSLDGFVARPDGDLDWADANEEHHEYANALIESVDLALFGRVTYQIFADYWPTAPDSPETPAWEVEYAHRVNRTPKIVYSTTLENVAWETRIAREVDPAAVVALKQQPGKDILIYASANLTATFMRLGLIDEYQLLVQPVVLGSGIPLFKEGIALTLKLTGTRTFGTGAVLLTYQSA